MRDFFKDKAFFRNLFILIIPIVFQELLNSSVNLVDNFMVGKLEEVAITSVGICNQIFFVFNLVLFGINSGSAVFIGQYFGKGDFKGIYKIMGLGMVLSLLNSLLFFSAISFFPETLMRLYSQDELVIIEGIKYFKIIAPAYFLVSFISIVNSALKATRNTAYPMITTFISLITNIILNYVFIFKMQLGVQGAAIATLSARLVELLAQAIIVYARKLPIIANIKEYFKFEKEFVKSFFIICSPVILNEIFWAVGIAICNAAYKYSGTNAQAAIQITGTIQNLFVVVGVAIGGGCGILLSNLLGVGDKEKAISYSKKCMILTVILSSFMGIVLLLVSDFIVAQFNITDTVRDYSLKILKIVAFGIIFKTFNYTTIVGILRSGGDTKYTLLLDFATVWFIGIPMAFLGSYFLGLPVYVTYAMVYLEEIIKCFFSFTRVKKEKWVNTIVN